MTTGEKIKRLRTTRGMSQEELGKMVGVKKAAIYKYENGIVVNLKRSVIEKLASALDTTPMYLLGLEEKPATDNDDGLSEKKRAVIEKIKTLDEAQADTLNLIVDSILAMREKEKD